MSLERLLQLALPASIAITVFAFGLAVRREDGWYLMRRPGLLFRSFLSLQLLPPLVAVTLTAVFALDPALEVTLVALAVSPVSPLVPSKEIRAGGSGSYVAGLFAGSALAAVVMVPLLIHLVGIAQGRLDPVTAATAAPPLLITVLVPMMLAAAARGGLGRPTAQRLSAPLRRIGGVLLLIAFLPIAMASFHGMIELMGDGTLLAIATLVVACLTFGHLLGGPERANRKVLATSTAARHPAVAIAVATTAAPADELVTAAVLLYLAVSSALSALYLRWAEHRRPAPVVALPAD